METPETPEQNPQAEIKAKNLKMAKRLGWVFAGMLAFTAINVPLFRLVCQRIGLTGGGKGAALAVQKLSPADASRLVAVRFMGTVTGGLPMEFNPKVPAMVVHLDRSYTVYYHFANLTNHTEEIQAVHSLIPIEANSAFIRTQCFCFTQQTLKPHQSKDMPVSFHIEPSLPQDDNSLTLNYTIYNLHPKPQPQQG